MILVTGATGTNGVELIKLLSAAGEPVRALVRNPEKAASLLPEDVHLFRGDLEDRESLEEAIRDVDKVFLLCAVDQRQVDLEWNVIDLAAQAGVEHLVKFSVIQACATSSSRLVRWHFATEEAIRSSKIPFTFLRPNMFMQEILRQADVIKTQGAFYLPFAVEQRISLVDVRDNAAVAAAALTRSGHAGKTYDVTGPAAVSMPEVAAALSQVVGRHVNYVPVTMEQFRQSFAATGAPGWMVDVIAELYESFPGHNDVVGDGVKEATGTPARGIAEFAKDYAGSMRAG